MLSDYLITPSLNSLFVTGVLILSIFFLIIMNFKQVMKHRLYEKIAILCMLSIAVGSHGLIHLGVEREYGFNPYKWF
jgi:hypothetical protein